METLEIGAMSIAMADKLLTETLYKVIEKTKKDKPDLKQYWILITAKPDKLDRRVLRQGIKVTNVKPPKLLNSMVFYVDTTTGELRNEWILPLDLGEGADSLVDGEESVAIMQSIDRMAGVLS